jgi:RNA polymerase sigma-70 factor (ECF subfamily)
MKSVLPQRVVDDPEEELALLVEEARDGSREAFDSLIRRFERRVMRTALYLTGNLADAEDVAQEVYIKVFRFLGDQREADKLERWIYRITVNTVRDLRRRRVLRLPLEVVTAVSRWRDPVARREVRSRMLAALSRLSAKERASFVLTQLEELETAEAAAILGCTPVTVRGHLHSARAKLRRSFREFEDWVWTDF